MVRRNRRKEEVVERIATASIEKALRWSFVLATRLMGIRPVDDQASASIREIYQQLIMLRIEVNALNDFLEETTTFDRERMLRMWGEQAESLNSGFETQFPGLLVTEDGIEFNQETFDEKTSEMRVEDMPRTAHN